MTGRRTRRSPILDRRPHLGRICGSWPRAEFSAAGPVPADQVAHQRGGPFPNEAGVLRLAGSVLLGVHDEWQVTERRYLSEGSMAKIYETDNDDKTNKEVGTTSKELLAG